MSASAGLAAALEATKARIASALSSAGRASDAARLVAVTKSVGRPVVRALVALGVRDLGENRPEVLPERSTWVDPGTVRWHMIGHFQSRKIRPCLPYLARVHSVHDESLLRKLDQAAQSLGRVVPVLLQVNVSGEAQKQGFRPEALESALSAAASLRHARVDGFMTIAEEGRPEPVLRRTFAALRDLRDRWDSPALPLPELSMGMSQDFEAALKEGATLVRIGSALFEGLSGIG